MPLSRRDFLLGATGAAVLAACSGGSDTTNRSTASSSVTTTAPVPPLPGQPFTLGVASGDPAPGSVVLWTRLAPTPLAGGGMPAEDFPVVWEVATDDAFADIVASGVVTAEPRYAHSVHVLAEGLSDTVDYRYRFRAGEFTSPVGRTRTPPTSGASSLQFAFASCQDFQDGFWPAHTHLAGEQLDLVVWLGDYIYEGGVNETAVRQHDGPEPTTLDGYRNRYGLYKSEPDLQAAHAARPWLVTWDDHEVDNNYAGDASQDSVPVGDFLTRRAAAYQAWWEHMPVRLEPPAGPTFEINRVLEWGGLTSFFAIDTRQHRVNQACARASDLGEGCPEVDDPGRQMLGAEQEEWLTEKMPASSAAWNVLANQVIFSPSPIDLGGSKLLNLDQWDGYPVARARMLDVLARTDNCVIITGDIHASAVADVQKGDEVVATEFVGTSVSSSFPEAFVDLFESAAAASGALMADARHHGYVRCTVTPSSFTADYRVVESVASPTSPVSTSASFVITNGQPGVRKA